MPGSRPEGVAVPIPGPCGPALIAHAAGNAAASAAEAINAGADFIEVDLWVHRGRFEARHERAIYPLPLWFEKWYLRRAPRHPFTLDELLRAAAGKAGVFLDLKNGGAEAAALLRETLDAAGPGLPLVVASSQQWHILREVQAVAPEVALFYSVDVPASRELFRSIAERDLQPWGVSRARLVLRDGAPIHEAPRAHG